MRIEKTIACGWIFLFLTIGLISIAWAADTLSKEKIIEIAKTKAIASGYDVTDKQIDYREEQSALDKGSFAVVRFWRKNKNIMGGGFEVRVNRETGEAVYGFALI